MKNVIVFLVVLSGYICGQVEFSAESNSHGANAFYYQVACSKSQQPNKTRVDAYIQVPYSSLSFTKKDNSFDASYTITLTLYDENKDNILSEKSWKEKLTTNTFEETVSRKNFNISYKTMDLTPGNYVLKTMFEDGNSRRTAFRENKLVVRSLSDSFALSDIILISEIIKDPANDRIIPNISNTVTNHDDSLSFFFTLYSSKAEKFLLEYYLNDPQKRNITKQVDSCSAKVGANFINPVMKKLSFTMGSYILKVVVKDKSGKEIDSVKTTFYSRMFGVPLSIVDLDKAVSQLIYIALPDEKTYIEEAKEYNEKMKRFVEFWDRKKPNPRVEDNPILVEYYRRVEYANNNFKGLGEGWRSDMGMIYITFGPPSQVERHPMDSDSKPYEIWYYNELDRSFVFVDDTGFNNYRLYNPDFSRWPGYRQ